MTEYIVTRITGAAPVKYKNQFVVEATHDRNDGDEIPTKFIMLDRYELDLFVNLNAYLRDHLYTHDSLENIKMCVGSFIVEHENAFKLPVKDPITDKDATTDSLFEWYSDNFLGWTPEGINIIPEVQRIYWYDNKGIKNNVETEYKSIP